MCVSTFVCILIYIWFANGNYQALQYTTYQYQTWKNVSGSADYTVKRKDGVTTISGSGPSMTATLPPEQQIPGHNPSAWTSVSIISFTWD